MFFLPFYKLFFKELKKKKKQTNKKRTANLQPIQTFATEQYRTMETQRNYYEYILN